MNSSSALDFHALLSDIRLAPVACAVTRALLADPMKAAQVAQLDAYTASLVYRAAVMGPDRVLGNCPVSVAGGEVTAQSVCAEVLNFIGQGNVLHTEGKVLSKEAHSPQSSDVARTKSLTHLTPQPAFLSYYYQAALAQPQRRDDLTHYETDLQLRLLDCILHGGHEAQ